jgi:hypothetical protein
MGTDNVSAFSIQLSARAIEGQGPYDHISEGDPFAESTRRMGDAAVPK